MTTAARRPSKKAVGSKKAPGKKKPPGSPAKPAPQRGGITVREVRISPSGARWTVLLSDGARIAVEASAAQAAGVRTGARWTAALARAIERAAQEQRLITRAMGLLSKGFAGDRAALRKALGGDAPATRAVRSLAENGWIA